MVCAHEQVEDSTPHMGHVILSPSFPSVCLMCRNIVMQTTDFAKRYMLVFLKWGHWESDLLQS